MIPEQGIDRELGVGEVISKTFELYRRDFTKYFLLFLVVELAIGLITALAESVFILPTLPASPTTQQVLNWLPAFFEALVPLTASIFVITVVFFPIAQGGAIKLASEQVENRQVDLGASVRFAVSKLIWIWGLSIVVGIIVVLGFIALVIPGIILTIMFVLAFPVLIVENKGISASMGRSRELVGHRWLKTFATLFILGIIVAVASEVVSVISTPFGSASPVVSGVLSAFYQPLFPILLTVYYYSNVARVTPRPSPVQSMQPSPIQAGFKFCPSCGTQMISSALFCPKCGAKQPT